MNPHTFLESIHSCVMCMNIEIASVVFEICIIPEPGTTSGTGLLLDRDSGILPLSYLLSVETLSPLTIDSVCVPLSKFAFGGRYCI